MCVVFAEAKHFIAINHASDLTCDSFYMADFFHNLSKQGFDVDQLLFQVFDTELHSPHRAFRRREGHCVIGGSVCELIARSRNLIMVDLFNACSFKPVSALDSPAKLFAGNKSVFKAWSDFKENEDDYELIPQKGVSDVGDDFGTI